MAKLYRDLVALLETAGCEKIRQGKHEIWYSPITRLHFPVPRSVKSKHTANAVLK